MSFPQYPHYSTTGFALLEEIPSHWKLDPLKHHCAIHPSNIDKLSNDHEQPVRLCNYTDVYYNDTITNELDFMRATASSSQITKFRLRAGDTIITKDSETADDIAVPAYVPKSLEDVVCGYHLAIIRPCPQLYGKYIKYLFDAPPLREHCEISARGLTRVGLSLQSLGTALIPLPPKLEQERISLFLDHETAKIDALVEEQKRLIALLKEKRQAVISHAVTKGLDPNVPMKDSGVEWLGNIPAQWWVARVSELFNEVSEIGSSQLPVLQVSIHSGVSDRELSEDEYEKKTVRIEDREKYKRVRPGDLTYNMMRAWQGAFGAVTVDGQVSPAYVVARPSQLDLSRFVEWQLRSPCGISEMRRYSYGVADFRMRLYWEDFKTLRVAVPPHDERKAIMNRISTETESLRNLEEEAARTIHLLTERRSALISAAVTGKIDVRNWKPSDSSADIKQPLPMAAEEPASYG